MITFKMVLNMCTTDFLYIQQQKKKKISLHSLWKSLPLSPHSELIFLFTVAILMGYFDSLKGTMTIEPRIGTNFKLSKQTLKIHETMTNKMQRETKLYNCTKCYKTG